MSFVDNRSSRGSGGGSGGGSGAKKIDHEVFDDLNLLFFMLVLFLLSLRPVCSC